MSEQELPPVLTEPVIDSEPRNFSGWILLTIILALLCVSSLVRSLAPDQTAKKQEPASPYQILVEQEASMRAMAQKLVDMGAGAESAANLKTQAQDSLSETISTLVDKSKTDADASRWYAAMRTEQGKPVPFENLGPLRRSKNPVDAALVRLYSANTLSKTEADSLAKTIGKKTFLDRLASMQALEKAGDKKIRGQTFSWRVAIGRTVALLIGMTIFVAGSIAWVVFLRGRASGGFQPLGPPLGQISDATADRLAMRAAQILLTFIALGVIGAYMGGSAGMVFNGVGILLALPILARVPIGGRCLGLRDVGLTTEKLGENVLWGVAGFVAEFPLSIAMLLLGMLLFSFLPTPTHPIDKDLLNANSIGQLLPIIFFGSITAPIWEEFVFRGLIFPGLARVTRKVPLAAIMTGFIFAMIHPQGIVLWCALATVGTIGCALTYQRRSLVPTIVMHLLHNTTLFAIALLASGKF